MPVILPSVRTPRRRRDPVHRPAGRCPGYPGEVLSLSRAGSGEPLLLLHGMGSSQRDFAAVLPLLTARFDVLDVDLPGVGRSPALDERPTVAAITDAVERTLDAED